MTPAHRAATSLPRSPREMVVAPYRFRRARPSDGPALARQRARMFREMGGIPGPKIARHVRVFRRWLRHEMRAHRLWGFVAETLEGAPVAGGLLWLQPRPPSPRFPHRRIPYLMSVYTEPRHRRRGLAARIVSELIDSSRRRGYPRVELFATEAGRSIYVRLGFRATNQMRLDDLSPSTSPRPSPLAVRGGDRRREVAGLSSPTE